VVDAGIKAKPEEIFTLSALSQPQPIPNIVPLQIFSFDERPV
jgi:hypothetical protein